MYFCSMKVNNFTSAGGDHLAIETIMRKYAIFHAECHQDQCLPELYIESHSIDHTMRMFHKEKFTIPALICAFFIQYLCHCKLDNQQKRDEALHELSLIIFNDDRHHIRQWYLPESWQILGICQQMSGHDQAACCSYLMALHHQGNIHKAATCIRLGTILVRYITPRD